MNFPERIRQHKNESDSFAIILYKFRELGIFRNVTESDYGIDFEIEVVNGNHVEGHCLKVQIKSSENLYIRKDGVATVGGINQSTLNYWAELSYSLPVVAMAVDVKLERVYVANMLFWQAIQNLDHTDSSKTIEFGSCCDDKMNVEKMRQIAYAYGLRDLLYAHKWILRNIRAIFEMYIDSSWYDACCVNIDANMFKSFLENCKILLLSTNEFASHVSTNLSSSFDMKAHIAKSDSEEDIYNYVIKDAMKPLLKPLIKTLSIYRDRVLNSFYYWLDKDAEYLRLVFNTRWPIFNDDKELMNFDFDSLYGWKFDPNKEFFIFLSNKAAEMHIDELKFIQRYEC